MADSHYDLIVIGSGPAGERGAARAASLGRKVALVEREAVVGGTASNLGTLPSKTLREAANTLSTFRQRGVHGATLTLQEPVNLDNFLHRERLLRQLEQARIRGFLESHKVVVLHGEASFDDGHTVRIRDRDGGGEGTDAVLHADVILIATGAMSAAPPESLRGHPAILDAERILGLRELPRKLALVGNGVIACEYASILAAFGAQVTLVNEDARLLPFLDGDVSAALLASLKAQGIQVLMGEQVVAAGPENRFGLVLASGKSVECDAAFLAHRRRGNTDALNLGAAGLEADDRGLIRVNAFQQTSAPHIYAAGDVTGFPGLASAARDQAQAAMTHAFAPQEDRRNSPIQPYGIYTIPECSMAGATEERLRAEGVDFLSGTAHFAANARGQILGSKAGFLKLLFDRGTLQLLGVHIIGEQASELVHTGLLALQMRATTQVFTDMCFNYPTLGELYKAATLDALARLQARPPAKLLPRMK